MGRSCPTIGASVTQLQAGCVQEAVLAEEEKQIASDHNTRFLDFYLDIRSCLCVIFAFYLNWEASIERPW